MKKLKHFNSHKIILLRNAVYRWEICENFPKKFVCFSHPIGFKCDVVPCIDVAPH